MVAECKCQITYDLVFEDDLDNLIRPDNSFWGIVSTPWVRGYNTSNCYLMTDREKDTSNYTDKKWRSSSRNKLDQRGNSRAWRNVLPLSHSCELCGRLNSLLGRFMWVVIFTAISKNVSFRVLGHPYHPSGNSREFLAVDDSITSQLLKKQRQSIVID